MTSVGSINEPELIRKMQAGDRKAMHAAYDVYSGYLAAVCSRYVVTAEDVRDILQDAFVKIFSSISSFRPVENASLKSWMTRIVVNEALKFIKRQKTFNFMESTGSIPDIAEDGMPDTRSVPFAVIYEMVRRLPPGCRTVFNLFVFEEKSHKEIAKMLEISEGTSASQYHRAKNLLAKEIREYIKETT